MSGVTIHHLGVQGVDYRARFLPEKGMNLVSFCAAEIEVIDQKTRPLFEERFAGLGAMIGPHFYQRAPSQIPSIDFSEVFPHIKKLKEQGKNEFFSHGIGRYVPWRVLAKSSQSLQASLSSSDKYCGYRLGDIEGMEFEMHYLATMTEQGLEILLKFKGSKPCTMGLHTYYPILGNQAKIQAAVQPVYNKEGEFLQIPKEWLNESGQLRIDALNGTWDYGFLSAPSENRGEIQFSSEEYGLEISYEASEGSFQIYRPKESSFVCIEPIAARNPRRLFSKEGEIKVGIKISA